MSKHTPGPWFHSDTSMWACATTKPDGHGYVIAEAADVRTIGMLGDERRVEESKANARLIAAAPELLEALKKLAQAAGDRNISPGFGLEPLVEAARAAIAKAEGER